MKVKDRNGRHMKTKAKMAAAGLALLAGASEGRAGINRHMEDRR